MRHTALWFLKSQINDFSDIAYILNSTRLWTGSQCNWRNSGVMWSHLRAWYVLNMACAEHILCDVRRATDQKWSKWHS